MYMHVCTLYISIWGALTAAATGQRRELGGGGAGGHEASLRARAAGQGTDLAAQAGGSQRCSLAMCCLTV